MVFRVPMSPTKSKRYWGTQRVARVLQVTPATVASWIDQGHLKGHKTPTGRRRVASADLAEFLRAHDMSVPSELLVVRDRPVVVVVEDDPGYLAALVRTIEREAPEVGRLVDTSKRLTAPVMIVTGGMPANAENDLRALGVRAIVNKVDGMGVVIEAMRRALQSRKVA